MATGDPMGAGMCLQGARAWGGEDKRGQCHFSDACLEDLPCRVRMSFSKAKEDEAKIHRVWKCAQAKKLLLERFIIRAISQEKLWMKTSREKPSVLLELLR